MERCKSPSFEITAVCFPATQRPRVSQLGFRVRVHLPDASVPYSYGGVLSLLKDGNWDCDAWQISRGADGDDPAPEMDFLALPEGMMTALYDTLIATLDSPIRPDNAIVMNNDEFNKSFYIY